MREVQVYGGDGIDHPFVYRTSIEVESWGKLIDPAQTVGNATYDFNFKDPMDAGGKAFELSNYIGGPIDIVLIPNNKRPKQKPLSVTGTLLIVRQGNSEYQTEIVVRE